MPSTARTKWPKSGLRWFRFLAAVDVGWRRAQRGEVRDFVLWLRTCHNPARDRRRPDVPAAGSMNARTGKAYLRSGYAPATINHAVSVLAEFYDFHVRAGTGPVVSPVPPRQHRGGRVFAHHNPMEPYPAHPRGAYRQKQPQLQPRAVPDDVLADLFADLNCHRDRALFSMFLSSGARVGELLSMTVADAHPGTGQIFVRGKGMGGAKQPAPLRRRRSPGWRCIWGSWPRTGIGRSRTSRCGGPAGARSGR
jgi:integrase/recombinase XerC